MGSKVNISTYALSHNVLPLIQRVSCPVIVLNLQPSEAIDRFINQIWLDNII